MNPLYDDDIDAAMPPGTVKTHATRGKAKLKAGLTAWHEAAGEERVP